VVGPVCAPPTFTRNFSMHSTGAVPGGRGGGGGGRRWATGAPASPDHGNMYGVLPFYAACKDAGVTP